MPARSQRNKVDWSFFRRSHATSRLILASLRDCSWAMRSCSFWSSSSETTVRTTSSRSSRVTTSWIVLSSSFLKRFILLLPTPALHSHTLFPIVGGVSGHRSWHSVSFDIFCKGQDYSRLIPINRRNEKDGN